MRAVLFSLIFSAFALPAFAAQPCYRDICVGDYVSSRSSQGYSLYGEVEGVKANGTIIVTWIEANGWPYHVPMVSWPYSALTKVN